MASRSAYRGQKRKLVLAFDVGTTYSGISYRFVRSILFSWSIIFAGACLIPFHDYSILDPGQTPEIKPVTRFVFWLGISFQTLA